MQIVKITYLQSFVVTIGDGFLDCGNIRPQFLS